MAEVSHVLARLRREPLADLPISDRLHQLLAEGGHAWRERLLPPLVTLRLFLIQVLSGNVAIGALRQLAGLDFAPSSFCEARARMPLQVLQSLLHWLHEQATQSLGIARQIGPRILVADGSSYSMPDTPELRDHFDLPPGTKPGVGYPMGKLMGLHDLATGMFVSLLDFGELSRAALPLFQHDMRGVIALHPMLREGDILLASAVSSAERETGRFAASAIWSCSTLAAYSPPCACTNAARKKPAESIAGNDRSRPRRGWTRRALPPCPNIWTCASSATRSFAQATAPATC